MLKDEPVFFVMGRSPSIIVPQSNDVILALPSIDPKMEELGVCVAFAKVSDSGRLSFTRPFQGCKTFNPSLEVGAETSLFRGEVSGFLGNVEL
jgi:hypothetical protein